MEIERITRIECQSGRNCSCSPEASFSLSSNQTMFNFVCYFFRSFDDSIESRGSVNSSYADLLEASDVVVRILRFYLQSISDGRRFYWRMVNNG